MPLIEIRQTSESTEINGYPCDKAVILSDSQQIRRMCVAEWDEIEGGEETAEVFEEMSAFFSEMMASFSHAAGGMSGDDLSGGAFGQLSELGGFPVFSEELAYDGSLESESTLRSVRRQDFETDAFEPPAGYKRRSMGPQ